MAVDSPFRGTIIGPWGHRDARAAAVTPGASRVTAPRCDGPVRRVS